MTLHFHELDFEIMVSDHSSPNFTTIGHRDWLTLLEDMMKKDCVDLSSSEQVAQLLQRQKVFIIYDIHIYGI